MSNSPLAQERDRKTFSFKKLLGILVQKCLKTNPQKQDKTIGKQDKTIHAVMHCISQHLLLSMSLRATSSLSLNTHSDRDSTTSLGNSFQCLTAVFGKKYLLIVTCSQRKGKWEARHALCHVAEVQGRDRDNGHLGKTPGQQSQAPAPKKPALPVRRSRQAASAYHTG